MRNDYSWYIISVKRSEEESILSRITNKVKKESLEISYLKLFSERNRYDSLKGYIACYCKMSEKLVEKIYSVKGVYNFLTHDRSSEKSLPFENLEIAIKKLSGHGQIDELDFKGYRKDKRGIFIGNTVIVKDGFFKDMVGIVEKVSGNEEKILEIVPSFLFNDDTKVKIMEKRCKKI